MKRNYQRRTIGILLCFAPVVFVAVSLVVGLATENWGGYSGLLVGGGGLILAYVNFDLSYSRPRRYFRRQGSMIGYHHVSGLPLIGEVVTMIASIVAFGEIPTAAIGLVALALDTGGSPWFLIATWKDRSFWDDEKPTNSM